MKEGSIIKCINDKNQPEGACVVEGEKYTVISSRMNHFGQKVVFLVEVPNNGTTSKGLQWNGYDAERFGTTMEDFVEAEEVEHALN